MAEELGVEMSLAAEAPVVVIGDRDELVRVAENLIENAIKYGARAEEGAAGKVAIKVERRGKEGVLEVRDFGCGIAPEHLPRLTERFYRVDRGRSRETGGTGLGLSIVKHALARHQAALSIDSTPGKGSCFSARFPAARLAPAAQKVAG